MTNPFKPGDEVIRKSGRRVIGTVIAVNTTKCRVRWHNALRPFSGGYSDNHTTVSASTLIPASEENRQKLQAQVAERNAAIRAERATYRYCETCRSRMFSQYCCNCEREAWEGERGA